MVIDRSRGGDNCKYLDLLAQKRYNKTVLPAERGEGERMKKLYCIRQAVWGRDKKQKLYFETEEEAEEYRNSHENVSKVGYVNVSEEEAKQLIENTCFELYLD